MGINQHGPRGYNSIIPMIKPSRKTIYSVLKKLKFRPGINNILMSAMSRISSMPENQKEVLIIFDEMALRVHFCYDSSADQVVGFFDLGNGERKDMPAEEV